VEARISNLYQSPSSRNVSLPLVIPCSRSSQPILEAFSDVRLPCLVGGFWRLRVGRVAGDAGMRSRGSGSTDNSHENCLKRIEGRILRTYSLSRLYGYSHRGLGDVRLPGLVACGSGRVSVESSRRQSRFLKLWRAHIYVGLAE
jgi:hypothetical protein